MSATVIQFPQRRRDHIKIEKRLNAAGVSTWHFDVIAADSRRVPVGVRDDIRDAAADLVWFRHGGMRVIGPADFEADVAQAIAEDFAGDLVEELAVGNDATLRSLLAPLRGRCVVVMLEFLGKPDVDPIEVPIALAAIAMAMSVRAFGLHHPEPDVANAELIVGRVAQRRLEHLFAGGAA